MKRIASVLAVLCLLVSCNEVPAGKAQVKLIFDTDMGNDVDDAVALDMIHKYIDDGVVDLLAICINKEGAKAAEFIDIMDTWYSHPDIPLGIIHDGAECSNPANEFTRFVAEMVNEDGALMFADRSITDYEALPDAVTLYRKVLAEQEDNSVTIASVGFSTNLARLLQTGPDEYSNLSGKELVEKKVKLLSLMAGDFTGLDYPEYNVVIDVSSAKTVFEQWPGELVTSPHELGEMVCYPATSIENDFPQPHPVVEAYKSYLPMPYDRPMWDPTALVYAVEGGSWFTVSDPGTISVRDNGVTDFVASQDGNRRYLSVDAAQAEALAFHIVELAVRP